MSLDQSTRTMLEDVIRQHSLKFCHEPVTPKSPAFGAIWKSVLTVLEMHQVRFAQAGIRDGARVIATLEAGQHFRSHHSEKGFILCESNGFILSDVILAQACVIRDSRAQEFWKGRLARWLNSEMPQFAPVLGREFPETMGAVFESFQSPQRLMKYDGNISLMSYLWMVLRTKYREWSKQLHEQQRRSGILPDEREASSPSRLKWREDLGQCYRSAVRRANQDRVQKRLKLSRRESEVLYELVFGEPSTNEIARRLSCLPTVVSRTKRLLRDKLKTLYERSFLEHAQQQGSDCQDLYVQNHPQARAAFQDAVRQHAPRWVALLENEPVTPMTPANVALDLLTEAMT